MKRKNNSQSLGEAIEHLLKTYKLKSKIQEMNLLNSWEKIVGKPIARRTLDLYIKNKKLFVKLDSAVVRQEMIYAQGNIIISLNKEAGSEVITGIIFG